ncbi:MAG: NUDIX domain-containing protein, partial [Vicinamibacteria bacterium]
MIRPAVSLAVSRRNRRKELLLVERSPKLRFFGGYHAFPGGTLDESDASVPVEGLTDPSMLQSLAAGARELFEETGLWLGRGESAPNAEELRRDRKRLLANEIAFAEILARHRQHLDARDLVPLCRMTTPPFAPMRFDTRFLRVLVSEDAEVEIWDGELVRGDFFDAGEILGRWKRGEVAIAPPMVMLLTEWAQGEEGLAERIREMTESYEKGKLHRIYFSPGILLVPLRTPTQPPATHTNTLVVGEERIYLVDPSPSDPGEQERLFDLISD